MLKNFDLVVFDWDGTLMDSAASIVHSLNAACADLGLPQPPEERARYVIGLGLGDALRHAVPELSADDYGRLIKRFRHHYLSGDHAVGLFAGIGALLEWLKKQEYLLAVATGKSRIGLTRAMAHTGLTSCFDATRCADESFSKPHPAMLEELLDEFAVAPERCLMIGDTTHDLCMAKNARAAALAVSYGAHSAELLLRESPLACLPTVRELSDWLQDNL